MPLKGVVLTAALVSAAALNLDSHRSIVELPIERVGSGHIIVPVTVNQYGSIPFVLDTAAQNSVLFRSTLERMPELEIEESTMRASGATGSIPVATICTNLFGLQLLECDGYCLISPSTPENYSVSGVDVQGILGVDYLNKFVVEIDFQNEILRVGRDLNLNENSEYRCVKIEDNGFGFYIVNAEFNNSSISIIIDLGSSRNVVNNRAFELLSQGGSMELKSARDLSGLSGLTSQATIFEFDGTINIGELRLQNIEIARIRTNIFEILGYGDRPAIIAGSDFFYNRSFGLDYNNDLFCTRV